MRGAEEGAGKSPNGMLSPGAKNGGEGTASYSYERSTTDTQSLELKNTSATKLTVPGPPMDGISHHRDVIVLC